ncbi:SAM-dependent methyltransferase [Chelatococcus reniformis]|uniref:Methyltransferase n=1 Tax=Chelatococcus reniformis TaxID=1494448 RepID=A0A916XFE6_9HYPH|nr:SAM-dependent methyltransferase [Chelatococcus reniformis]GGC66646.1 methyltransferase [Chelatococcus reniformis]
MRPAASLGAAYFRALYGTDPDPWSFATSDYERDKYAATLAALPHPRYRNAFEVGCSIGVLTAGLARRCDRLLAVDIAEEPLVAARQRCADLQHVRFARRAVPGQWPNETFDLIVLSEVVYYLAAADVEHLCARLVDGLEHGGHLLLVHWLGKTDYPLSGDAAAELVMARMAPVAEVLLQRRTDAYRLDMVARVR